MESRTTYLQRDYPRKERVQSEREPDQTFEEYLTTAPPWVANAPLPTQHQHYHYALMRGSRRTEWENAGVLGKLWLVLSGGEQRHDALHSPW